jgi:hypothetical protein
MTRSEKAITWRNGVATCTHCLTDHRFTPEQTRRGDGDVDLVPCHADSCTAMLCPDCPQFVCGGCELPHCLEHRIEYSGLSLCPVCMAEAAAVDAADLELASQGDAEFARAMAAAGLTLREAEAFAREVGRAN